MAISGNRISENNGWIIQAGLFLDEGHQVGAVGRRRADPSEVKREAGQYEQMGRFEIGAA
ncbi:hypothetical protein [Stutzerimonas nitrititolerans]|uniref:hypothetical protein n=1 Tax=Stutzerimonas nitrititolerans TaxID=2482751 RepID=UPI0028B254A3|nr:hypothetical protein [Stutzerimonas nitrititolerans]